MIRLIRDEEINDIFGWGFKRLVILGLNGKEIRTYLGEKVLVDELNKLASQGFSVFNVEGIKVIDLPKGYGAWLNDKALWITDNISREDLKEVIQFFKEREKMK
ncbi:MAG: hypothetical protein DSO07_04290 [Thermoproteota archaeon]|jgi:hypothetical protein|uniref:Uncharacterized protein n=1 Tax=Candidatus Methanodesulfokora washburnensis TaxID=2478471 RepID=A0A3R9PJM5_9CREN|nr:hypothetical protein [Candidatus Methanodesulfokores washburnensis]RSN78289.1 hypothetical protein D6D85_01380 [Candidatus Methanodesulfokores washburnensis]TDA41501.1 MAG: hypothetical protein DSO07_04290 [Candidatus Korarchaeota archaeon]